MTAAKKDPKQEELAFASALSHTQFPGRGNLYVHEVARALGCSRRHVVDLILEGRIRAFNIAGEGNKTDNKFWRIPVTAYDIFVRSNAS